MSIKLNSVGGGSVTIQEPNTASDFTLSVPAATANLLTNRTAGTVLQVVSVTKTDTFTTTSSSYTDITGLSVNITPTSTSNKILVVATLSYGGGQNAYGYAQILRNGTSIALGNSDSSNRTENTFPLNIENTASGDAKLMNAGMTILDSPATTSAITYKIQALSANSGTLVGINRSGGNSDNAFSGLGVSSITVMEIAA